MKDCFPTFGIHEVLDMGQIKSLFGKSNKDICKQKRTAELRESKHVAGDVDEEDQKEDEEAVQGDEPMGTEAARETNASLFGRLWKEGLIDG